jgi:hypothetical protein
MYWIKIIFVPYLRYRENYTRRNVIICTLRHIYNSSIRLIKSRRMRWVGHAAHIEMSSTNNGLFREPQGRRPLRRPRRRWKDNIKMGIK